MKFITTTASALAAAFAIAAPAAQAYTTNGHGVGFYDPADFGTGITGQLIQKLENHGIWVVDGSTLEGACDAEPGYKLYGYYSGSENYIAICPGLTTAEAVETITHEAVHAYQDYRAGLNNSELQAPANVRSLFAGLSESKQQAVLDYATEDQALETEAWFFESRPAEVLEAWTF